LPNEGEFIAEFSTQLCSWQINSRKSSAGKLRDWDGGTDVAARVARQTAFEAKQRPLRLKEQRGGL